MTFAWPLGLTASCSLQHAQQHVPELLWGRAWWGLSSVWFSSPDFSLSSGAAGARMHGQAGWVLAGSSPQLLAKALSTKGTSDVLLNTCCKGKCSIHIKGLLGATGREARALLEEATLPTPSKSICRSLLFSAHPLK